VTLMRRRNSSPCAAATLAHHRASPGTAIASPRSRPSAVVMMRGLDLSGDDPQEAQRSDRVSRRRRDRRCHSDDACARAQSKCASNAPACFAMTDTQNDQPDRRPCRSKRSAIAAVETGCARPSGPWKNKVFPCWLSRGSNSTLSRCGSALARRSLAALGPP
jgi:hypothetical protein